MSIKRTVNTWRTARRTAYELRRLSDRELEDVGMARGDIFEIALKSARSDAI